MSFVIKDYLATYFQIEDSWIEIDNKENTYLG